MYAPDWGCAGWTDMDYRWEIVDRFSGRCPNRFFFHGLRQCFYHFEILEHALMVNDAATLIRNNLRLTCRPEDLRLVNCARKIKRAFRRASNDPSYELCRRRVLLFDDEEGLYAR